MSNEVPPELIIPICILIYSIVVLVYAITYWIIIDIMVTKKKLKL